MESKISRRLGISIGIVALIVWLLVGQKYFGLPNTETLEHASNGILTFEDIQRWAVFLIMMGGVISFYYVPTKNSSDSIKAEIEALYEKNESQLNEREKKELSFYKFYDSMNRLGHLILKIGLILLLIGTIFRTV
ncbi:hypothetical protein B649_05645 [Candidatus Sulfuricurvum sp. RIFRC-1]|nr:hypothetical protein B649_05645 [Candidatus Sulfuricurvum sp. RIFRC-1]HBM35137.1 hypothetical protein [Sulfuricurvum sp.]